MQLTTLFHIAVVAVVCHLINGYTLDQLLNANSVSSSTIGKSDATSHDTDRNALVTQFNPASYSKKSLKKFQGNGSRNCFFSPITCMIHHDVSKYRKLVDNSYYGAGAVSKRLW
ncbi:hypothetical protein QR680_001293 [Steinernema hermaphroditum]|uniref:Uncharacterized protein n=1 Tax=Steinernema hermaphroditum TaxID=289476 RepID=A0AA39GZL5_9BILA|nr:hypothetical protein QR680_001293 [Steinernema hermaphroditum]